MNNFGEVEINEDSLDLYLETVIPFLKDRNKESNPEMGIFVRNIALPVYNKIKDNFYNGMGNKGETFGMHTMQSLNITHMTNNTKTG